MIKLDNLRDSMLLQSILEDKDDYKSYRELYKLYYDEVFKYLFCKLGDYDKSNQLTNEILHKLLEGIKNKTIQIGNFRHLVFTCAKNKFIDEYRKKQRLRKTRGLDVSIHFSGESALDNLYDETINTEVSLIKNEEANYLHYCINTYIKNKKHRVFLKLYHFKGVSYKRISEIFEVKEGTVKSSIHAAMNVLRANMIKKEAA